MRHIKTIVLFLFLISCSDNRDNYLVKYKDVSLKKSEIESILYNNHNIDSAKFVQSYIEDWLLHQIVFNHAKSKIDLEEYNITEKVKIYEQRLIIEEYKNILLNNFDTNINKFQIEKLYEEQCIRQEDYIYLKNDIFKIKLIVIDRDRNTLNYIKDKLLDSTYSIDQLDKFCDMNSVFYYLNDSVWKDGGIIKSELSKLSIKQQKNLLYSKNKINSITVDNLMYIIFVNDFREKGSVAPLSYLYEDIRNILKHKNKIRFIDSVFNELYKESYNSNEIKIQSQ